MMKSQCTGLLVILAFLKTETKKFAMNLQQAFLCPSLKTQHIINVKYICSQVIQSNQEAVSNMQQ